MNNFKKFIHLETVDKKLLFQAIIISIFIKILVTFFPLKWYAKILGKEHSDHTEKFFNNNHVIYKISRAMVRCRKVLPWKVTCFIEAITAKILLKKHGIESTLHLGLKKENSSMLAHAWLHCGSIYVTGKRGIEKFVTVRIFS
jgi:hypothetical protein